MSHRGLLAKTVVLLFVVLGTIGRAHAAPIVTFDFNDFNATADVVAANVTVTPFTNGGSLSSESFASGAANARGWNPSESAADALTQTDYWTFTVTAAPGFEFDVESIAFDEWRESSGPLQFQLFSNGGLIGSSAPTSAVSTNHVIAAPATDLTSLIVRILAWDAANNGANADWYLDNVTLSGTIRAQSDEQNTEPESPTVPEPASLLLLGTGMALAVRRLRGRA